MLVVLSLLVLFTILSLTFVLVSTQFRYAAISDARRAVYENDPREDSDRVLYSILRENDNTTPFTGHGLLRDLYGGDAVSAQLNPSPGGASILFSGLSAAPAGRAGDLARIRVTITTPPVNGLHNRYFNGRVMTFINGPLKGFSRRIVNCEVVPAVAAPTQMDLSFLIVHGDSDLLRGRDQQPGHRDVGDLAVEGEDQEDADRGRGHLHLHVGHRRPEHLQVLDQADVPAGDLQRPREEDLPDEQEGQQPAPALRAEALPKEDVGPPEAGSAAPSSATTRPSARAITRCRPATPGRTGACPG